MPVPEGKKRRQGDREKDQKMNVVTLVGRLTKDVDDRATQSGMSVARYTLAVDRRFRKEGEPTADFIPCIAFGKTADFAAKYFRKGMRVGVTGRIQTGSYTDRDGKKVYTTDIVVDNQEFAEDKKKDDFVAADSEVDDLFG